MLFNKKPFYAEFITGHVDSINNRFYVNIANMELRRTQSVTFINWNIRDMMVRSYEKDS